MKAVLLLLVLGLLYVFMKNDVKTKSTYDKPTRAIPTSIIQVILEKVQNKLGPSLVPIETLFVNETSDHNFTGRFLFIDTNTYAGSQYDVDASVADDGEVVINKMSSSAQVGVFADGFTPYKPDQYSDFQDIKNANAILISKLGSDKAGSLNSRY